MGEAAEKIRTLEERCRRLEGGLAEARQGTPVEKDLLEAQRDLERAQALARVGSWRFDLEAGVVLASRETRRIYGVRNGPLTIEEIQTVPLPEYRDFLDGTLRDLIQAGKPYDVEFRIRRPVDGAIRWIHSVAEYDPDRNVVLGTIHDVTESREADQEISRNRVRLRAIVEILQHDGESLQGFLDHALNQAIQLTDSRFGYIYQAAPRRRFGEVPGSARLFVE